MNKEQILKLKEAAESELVAFCDKVAESNTTENFTGPGFDMLSKAEDGLNKVEDSYKQIEGALEFVKMEHQDHGVNCDFVNLLKFVALVDEYRANEQDR